MSTVPTHCPDCGVALNPDGSVDNLPEAPAEHYVGCRMHEHVCRTTYRRGVPICQTCEDHVDALLDQECNLPSRPIGLDSELKRHLDGYER